MENSADNIDLWFVTILAFVSLIIGIALMIKKVINDRRKKEGRNFLSTSGGNYPLRGRRSSLCDLPTANREDFSDEENRELAERGDSRNR